MGDNSETHLMNWEDTRLEDSDIFRVCMTWSMRKGVGQFDGLCNLHFLLLLDIYMCKEISHVAVSWLIQPDVTLSMWIFSFLCPIMLGPTLSLP